MAAKTMMETGCLQTHARRSTWTDGSWISAWAKTSRTPSAGPAATTTAECWAESHCPVSGESRGRKASWSGCALARRGRTSFAPVAGPTLRPTSKTCCASTGAVPEPYCGDYTNWPAGGLRVAQAGDAGCWQIQTSAGCCWAARATAGPTKTAAPEGAAGADLDQAAPQTPRNCRVDCLCFAAETRASAAAPRTRDEAEHARDCQGPPERGLERARCCAQGRPCLAAAGGT